MKEYSSQKIYDKVAEYAELKNKKILEIGCGAGRISSFLAKETNLLIAIDPDENAIRKAKDSVSGVVFRVGSGENLDFPNTFFDLVIFTLSLHHQNSSKALVEAARVLKLGGKIIVIEPVIEGEIEILFSFLRDENVEKIGAQNSIVNSGLYIVASEYFTAEWIFENEDDLYLSVFEYYNMPFNSDTALKISTFLSEKIKSNPIICEDKMIIQTLKTAC